MTNLLKIRKYLHDNLGLHYNDNQEKELYNKLKAAAKGFDIEDTDLFIDWLVTHKLKERPSIEITERKIHRKPTAHLYTFGFLPTHKINPKKPKEYKSFHR